MEILKKTLSEMNFTFSSNEFSKKAKKNGLSKREIDNGVIALFLHRNAVQGETRRMWRKHNGLTSDKHKSDKIMDAIDLLKTNGYKILKPVSDWIEL
ncbi:MAG TPA: hypothetical protein PK210_12465 [Bacteroidia bacterium]|nr:hypothetical protein [Bacteroidia bacterium]